jgi:molybdopterin converting factor small subunit
MAVHVRIPVLLRKVTGGATIVRTAEGRLDELILRIDGDYPGFKETLCRPDGRLKKLYKIFVNGKDVTDLDGLSTRLVDGDDINILFAIAGG